MGSGFKYHTTVAHYIESFHLSCFSWFLYLFDFFAVSSLFLPLFDTPMFFLSGRLKYRLCS